MLGSAVACTGPMLRTSMQNASSDPTGGVVFKNENPMLRSAFRLGVTPTVAVLLAGLGSGSLAVTVAVRSYGPVSLTVAERHIRVLLMPPPNVPIVQTPVTLS